MEQEYDKEPLLPSPWRLMCQLLQLLIIIFSLKTAIMFFLTAWLVLSGLIIDGHGWIARGERAWTRGSGSVGLGLHIVNQFAGLLNGENVESEPGTGSVSAVVTPAEI